MIIKVCCVKTSILTDTRVDFTVKKIGHMIVDGCFPYLTSFLVNSPTLSNCSSSGIRSSIRCCTISAILPTKIQQTNANLLFKRGNCLYYTCLHIRDFTVDPSNTWVQLPATTGNGSDLKHEFDSVPI